ncbi:argininosuccinate lyase, chloroplastic-like [Triticum dicoccoides]|uniref:argininosuccinate lyase, chloroplastic-like n=1 Tax=Triticum dicoccoides TaxID=85692 RepID=UPI000E79D9A4|nr:argininosuccinate lyase, chloroplastic-like [Triticum dicoccoides]
MSVFAVKGSLRGPCFSAAGLSSGQNPRSSSFFDHPAPRSSAAPFPSMVWSTGSDPRHGKLKVQATEWMRPNDDYRYDVQPSQRHTDFICQPGPAMHIDLLNRERLRYPMRKERVVADQVKKRSKALQKRARDFADGLLEYICSENENYKYVLIATKENANMLMKEGFISNYARDEILHGLERIKKDIEEGRFQWRNNKDLRTNIMDTLIDIVGGPAKRLDTAISHHVQLLTVLQLWCHDSIDEVISQIKELQTELFLLAIRNGGLVLPSIWRRANWILLGDVVLSQLEQLDMDVSQLVSCKNKMDSTLQTALPSDSTYCFMNSLCKDPRRIHKFAVEFGNLIVGDISRDLSNIGLELSSWMELHLLTPNDKVIESFSLMRKQMLDIDNLTTTWRAYSIYNPVEDSSRRFLAIFRSVSEILKAAKEFAKQSSFDHEKARTFLGPRDNFGASQLAEFHATKSLDGQNKDEGDSAIEKQNFRLHSDDTMRKLLDWPRRLQSEKNN